MATVDLAGVSDLQAFDAAEPALGHITEIYEASAQLIRRCFGAFMAGTLKEAPLSACYPYLAIEVAAGRINLDSRPSYGTIPVAGIYGTTLTRPDLFRSYYLEQIEALLAHHGGPVLVGKSDRPIPLTFVVEHATTGLTAEDVPMLQALFPLPNLSAINDRIANGTYEAPPLAPKPLALFTAERVDLSLVRLTHYTGTSPEHFQRFVLFTNYQRYVDEFVEFGQAEVRDGNEYRAFVGPGDELVPNPRLTDQRASGAAPRHLPQMPAYHLVRDRHEGITLINIGIGPSNAKTITDHLAVLRPHCWLMVGHCGGLRHTQRLGDYVLAHAYERHDHVLDNDLPPTIPVPPIAEIQIALTEAVAHITGQSGRELKARFRTGTVFTTDDRDWELRHRDLALHFNQSRAIAIDMESATIAANGFRFRVPYGTLLCVSDKPMHGEVKLPGMANAFYRARIGQHLAIGIAALRALREGGPELVHSRKLRSYDEPAFR
jgi:AMP nucleosidase